MSGAQIQSLANSAARLARLDRVISQQPLLLIAVAAIAGVLINSWSNLVTGNDTLVSAVWIVLLLTNAAAVVGCRAPLIRRSAGILLALPLAGWFHCHSGMNYRQASILAILSSDPQPAIVEVLVDRPAILRRHPLADQSDRRDQPRWQTQLEASLLRIRVGQRFRPCDGRLMIVVTGRCDELRPGDNIRVHGTLGLPTSPMNPGQRDRSKGYRLRGIHARIEVDSPQQILSIGSRLRRAQPIRRTIASIANRSRDLLLRHTSPDTGPLAVALVIGRRDLVDTQTRDQLLVTGTAHLLSVSGLHLAIVVVLAHWLATLSRMPPSMRLVWILFVCAIYTAITGGRPPVMRAAILVGTFVFATWMRRTSQPINTLSLAALILIFSNPDLLFSVGVQLSFLAVATLFLCGRRGSSHSTSNERMQEREQRLEALVDRTRGRAARHFHSVVRATRQMTWFSLCVFSMSMPLVWYNFHVVAPISVVTNVLLSPFLFLSLALGVATVLCGMLCEPMAVLPGAGCDWTLRFMQWLIETAAVVPQGHHWLPSPSLWWVWMFYTVLAGTLLVSGSPRVHRFRVAWIATWTVVAWWLATTPSKLDKAVIEATFVHVGHGTCVVLRFSRHEVWLYDCGHLGNSSGSSRDIDTTLWSMGVTRLGGILLSHADADHYNALPGVLRRFDVDEIVTPPGMLAESEPALNAIRDAIDRAGTPIREWSRPLQMRHDATVVKVLHPPPRRVAGSDNANSLVLEILVAGKSLMLPGDLEPPGTAMLLDQPRPPPGGVLMAPHHGSLTLDATAILQWARPRATIVSGGKRASKPEVHQMLAVTGSEVYVTSTVGSVRVRIDSQGEVTVRAWKPDSW